MIIYKVNALDNPPRYQPLARLATMGNRHFSNRQSLPIHDPDVSKPLKTGRNILFEPSAKHCLTTAQRRAKFCP
jgi:hypothetical protein